MRYLIGFFVFLILAVLDLVCVLTFIPLLVLTFDNNKDFPMSYRFAQRLFLEGG